jgi:hypothetical protein
LDVKTTVEEEEDPNLDLLQPREKKRKEDKAPELVIQPIKSKTLIT